MLDHRLWAAGAIIVIAGVWAGTATAQDCREHFPWICLGSSDSAPEPSPEAPHTKDAVHPPVAGSAAKQQRASVSHSDPQATQPVANAAATAPRPKTHAMSPEEREALFQQFLEWKRQQDPKQ
jgi:hypothetical protein